MKTTVDFPDALFRKAKAAAFEEDKSLKNYLIEAVIDRLHRGPTGPSQSKHWKAAFGGLKSLHRENTRIAKLIAAEFERIDEEQWR